MSKSARALGLFMQLAVLLGLNKLNTAKAQRLKLELEAITPIPFMRFSEGSASLVRGERTLAYVALALLLGAIFAVIALKFGKTMDAIGMGGLALFLLVPAAVCVGAALMHPRLGLTPSTITYGGRLGRSRTIPMGAVSKIVVRIAREADANGVESMALEVRLATPSGEEALVGVDAACCFALLSVLPASATRQVVSVF
jgi:hypothetical protein